ncbi:arginase family protein [bacterium]|nr:arginase family protein [bacterium]
MNRRTPAPAELFFRGRPGDMRLGEWVNSAAPARQTFVILGYPDDQGVRLNRGRAGAAAGPDGFRKHFYKLTPPADFEWSGRVALQDWGNSHVVTGIQETHAIAEGNAAEIAAQGALGILIGGGHDFAAPSFKGFRSSAPRARWGLLNIDPHLDTREREGSGLHSGNPFRELLESGALKGQDLVQFGARANRNSKTSWEFCQRQGVSIQTLETIRSKPSALAFYRGLLKKLASRCPNVGVTIDLDSCCEAEGTSAAPVLGFSAWELCQFARAAGEIPGVRYLELAEGAPALDNAERVSRISAEIAFAFLDGKAHTKLKIAKKRR